MGHTVDHIMLHLLRETDFSNFGGNLIFMDFTKNFFP